MKRNLLFPILVLLTILVISCKDDELPIEPENPEEVEELPSSSLDTLVTSSGVPFVRTPDAQFENLPDWDYPYQYVEIEGLRQAYAEAGPADGEVVLLLHGQPSWSYLYRKMIPVLADAGYRVIAMDHLGMGRSDKPIDIDAYTYLGHNDRLEQFILSLGLTDINLFVQDWGSLIGLRVAGLNPDWFATISVGNGMLPVIPAGVEVFPTVEDPDSILDIPSIYASIPAQQIPFYEGCNLILGPEDEGFFGDWMEYAMKGASFQASETVEALTWYDLPDAVEAAYAAPFPSRTYMAGIRKFPSLINEVPGQTERAYAGLTNYEKPFLTIWGSNDPGNLGSCEVQQSFIDNVPGAAGKPHARLEEASHFLQDDQGEEIARRLVEFYRGNYTGGNFGEKVDVAEETCESDPNEDPRQYCEFLLAYQRNGALTAEVWGTQGLSNCPSGCLEEVDLAAVQSENGALVISLNGPRIWLPMGNAELPELGDSRVFGGLEVRLLATIDLSPEDLASGGEAGLGDPYEEYLVYRNTVYQYPAGSEVYELSSPEGEIYTMQSVSLIVDPNQTVNDLSSLASRLNLPEGWTYQVRSLDEELILIADGEAFVVTDDLGNTYQRRTFETDDGEDTQNPDNEDLEIKANYEIHQILSANEIITWASSELTQAEFDAIDLPQGWFKNQPREGDTDFGSFARSPNALTDGDLAEEEHFGHTWKHVATIVETGIEMDEEGLLSANKIAKFHTVGFNAGKTLNVLISPEGDRYVRITRDAGRTSDTPTIPDTWQLVEEILSEDLIIPLPNPTLNIRADNEDSFQGPLSAEELGL